MLEFTLIMKHAVLGLDLVTFQRAMNRNCPISYFLEIAGVHTSWHLVSIYITLIFKSSDGTARWIGHSGPLAETYTNAGE